MDYKIFTNIKDLPRRKRVTIVYPDSDSKGKSLESFIISDYRGSGGVYSEEHFRVGECDDRILKTIHFKDIWVEKSVEAAFITVYEDGLVYVKAGGNPKIIKELKKLKK